MKLIQEMVALSEEKMMFFTLTIPPGCKVSEADVEGEEEGDESFIQNQSVVTVEYIKKSGNTVKVYPVMDAKPDLSDSTEEKLQKAFDRWCSKRKINEAKNPQRSGQLADKPTTGTGKQLKRSGPFQVFQRERGGKTYYDFIEDPKDGNFKFDEDHAIVYTYAPESGNLTMGSSSLWARREILAASASGQKAGAGKALPDDLAGGLKAAQDHYKNYKPRQFKESVVSEGTQIQQHMNWLNVLAEQVAKEALKVQRAMLFEELDEADDEEDKKNLIEILSRPTALGQTTAEWFYDQDFGDEIEKQIKIQAKKFVSRKLDLVKEHGLNSKKSS